MAIVSLSSEDGILSTAIVDDWFWKSNEARVRQFAQHAMLDIDVFPTAEGLHPDWKVSSMTDVSAWIARARAMR
jgi:hypothetical protein